MAIDNNHLLEELNKLNLSIDEFRTLQQLDISLDDIKKLHGTLLWKSIQKKLKERQKQANVRFSLGVLDRLGKEKYRPSPHVDKITNPMNSLEAQKSGLDVQYTTVAEKRLLYNRAIDNNAMAIGFKDTIPLGSPGAEFNDVEFIAGLWRIQKEFPYKITNVRKKDFVLVKRLPHYERTNFEYYSAAAVVWGGSGCSADVSHPDWIVAKYKTPHGICWSYGRTIEEARAFLGIKLCDEFQDLFRATAFGESNQK